MYTKHIRWRYRMSRWYSSISYHRYLRQNVTNNQTVSDIFNSMLYSVICRLYVWKLFIRAMVILLWIGRHLNYTDRSINVKILSSDTITGSFKRQSYKPHMTCLLFFTNIDWGPLPGLPYNQDRDRYTKKRHKTTSDHKDTSSLLIATVAVEMKCPG